MTALVKTKSLWNLFLTIKEKDLGMQKTTVLGGQRDRQGGEIIVLMKMWRLQQVISEKNQTYLGWQCWKNFRSNDFHSFCLFTERKERICWKKVEKDADRYEFAWQHSLDTFSLISHSTKSFISIPLHVHITDNLPACIINISVYYKIKNNSEAATLYSLLVIFMLNLYVFVCFSHV